MQLFAWYLFTFAIVYTSTLVMQIGVEMLEPKPGFDLFGGIGTMLITILAALSWWGWWVWKDGANNEL